MNPKKILCLLVCAGLLACSPQGNAAGNADSATPTKYDVDIYVSTASRSMTFRKTGVDFAPQLSTSSQAIQLDAGVRYQQMEGFGAAITGAAAYNLMQMTSADRAQFLKEVFDPAEGIGYSYVRVPIGCSDYSLSEYTCCDQKGIENFALTNEDLNYIIPVLQEILTCNPALKIMGSPWTCPRWMKESSIAGWLPHNFWTGGHLRKDYYQDYAAYFVKWIDAFAEKGIPIYSVTPQNEPLNSGNTASLLMYWDEARDFVKTALGPALRGAGRDTKIYVFDHNYNYDNVSSQQEYPLKIYDDAQAAQYIAGAAYHNYGGSQDELLNIHRQRPDKDLIFSEASIGEWHDGRNLSTNLVGSIEESINLCRKWCSAVIVWNLMLDMNKRPCRSFNPVCYGAVDISMDYKTITRNCHYYEVGHLAQVVKPGAHRIQSNDNVDSDLRYVAFINADNTYAAVVLNTTDAAKTVTLADGVHSFSYKMPPKSVASMRWK
jgi:glucosylceramidase